MAVSICSIILLNVSSLLSFLSSASHLLFLSSAAHLPNLFGDFRSWRPFPPRARGLNDRDRRRLEERGDALFLLKGENDGDCGLLWYLFRGDRLRYRGDRLLDRYRGERLLDRGRFFELLSFFSASFRALMAAAFFLALSSKSCIWRLFALNSFSCLERLNSERVFIGIENSFKKSSGWEPAHFVWTGRLWTGAILIADASSREVLDVIALRTTEARGKTGFFTEAAGSGACGKTKKFKMWLNGES